MASWADLDRLADPEEALRHPSQRFDASVPVPSCEVTA